MEDANSSTLAEAPAKKRGCIFWGLIAVGVLVALIVVGMIVGEPGQKKQMASQPGTPTDASSNEEAEPEVATNDPEITAAEFASLAQGMSYQDAIEVIGSPGELMSESELAGIRTVMYQWEGNSFGGNANAMFQNDKLVNKAQFGLK